MDPTIFGLPILFIVIAGFVLISSKGRVQVNVEMIADFIERLTAEIDSDALPS